MIKIYKRTVRAYFRYRSIDRYKFEYFINKYIISPAIFKKLSILNNLLVFIAGTVIENLCETAFENSKNDRSAVVKAARCLLRSVTRVLLLADSVVVKQLLHAKEKVSTICLWSIN